MRVKNRFFFLFQHFYPFPFINKGSRAAKRKKRKSINKEPFLFRFAWQWQCRDFCNNKIKKIKSRMNDNYVTSFSMILLRTNVGMWRVGKGKLIWLSCIYSFCSSSLLLLHKPKSKISLSKHLIFLSLLLLLSPRCCCCCCCVYTLRDKHCSAYENYMEVNENWRLVRSRERERKKSSLSEFGGGGGWR